MILKAPTLDLYAHKEQHLSDPFGKNPVVQHLLDFFIEDSLIFFFLTKTRLSEMN